MLHRSLTECATAMFGLLAYPALGAYKSMRSLKGEGVKGVKTERLSRLERAATSVHPLDISTLVKTFRNVELA